MPINKEIQDRAANYEIYYSSLRGKQAENKSFYEDKFEVNIKEPYHVIRTGSARKIVDTPAAHILTSNPQAFREQRGETDIERKRNTKVTKLLQSWLNFLKAQNPQPIHTFIKDMLQGEAFMQISFPLKDKLPSLPPRFTVPDPTTIYVSPGEEKNFSPDHFIRKYKRVAWDIKSKYPNWTLPNEGTEDVNWLEYHDSKKRYFEANDNQILSGPNIFKCVPLVHAYSGLGRSQGKPEEMAVSVLEGAKSLLTEECYVASQISSIIQLFTNPIFILQPPPNFVEGEQKDKEISLVPGTTLTVPPGWQYKLVQGDTPSQQMYEHYYQIQAELRRYLPPVLQGLPSTGKSTGRLEDIYAEHSMVIYDYIVISAEYALAALLSKGLFILTQIPGMLPCTVYSDGDKKGETVTKEDIGDNFECTVKLAAPNPLQQDRLMMSGRAMNPNPGEGIIDWETNLTEYQGKSPTEARKIIVNQLRDRIIYSEPVLSMISQRMLENMGLGELVHQMKEQTQMAEAAQQAPVEQGEPRQFNARNPAAKDTIRQLLTQGGSRSTARR